MSEKQYNPNYKIYKPNLKDSSKGAATSWEYNTTTRNFFLTIAQQNKEKDAGGNPTFGWKEHSEMLKLDVEELAEIVLVTTKAKPSLGNLDDSNGKGKGFYHQTKDGNTILKIYQLETGFGLEISSKKEGVQFWSGQRISPSEAEVIKLMCEHAATRMIFG